MKKTDHIHLKRLAAISLVMVMCLSALPMLAPSASAGPIAASNEKIGDYVTFCQDYTTMYDVPANIALMPRHPSTTTEGHTLRYNYEQRAIELLTETNNSGIAELNIAGFGAHSRARRVIDVEISTNTVDMPWTINFGMSKPIAVFVFGTGDNKYLMIRSEALTPLDVKLQGDDWGQYGDLARFTLAVDTDFSSGTFDIYVDGKYVLTDTVIESYQTGFSRTLVTVQGRYINTARLYSITETVPEYRHVTPLPNPWITALGIDGPNGPETFTGAAALLQTHGGRGTIWADVRYVHSYHPESRAVIQELLDDGWELGIHYSKSLNLIPMDEAMDLMVSDYQNITETFGQTPTSWCSHGNEENLTHAQYAWDALSIAWRNGAYKGYAAPGALVDDYWIYHEALSSIGTSYSTYTHSIIDGGDPPNDISLTRFDAWVQNLENMGVRVVGYREWWNYAQNTGHTEISDLMVDDGKSMSFALDNIGGRSRLFVAAPWTEKVLDGDGNEIAWESVDGGIIMEVEAGEYQVFTQSAWRQDQIDTAMSPLYAIIPVVVVLAVVGGLFTMIGRIKI